MATGAFDAVRRALGQRRGLRQQYGWQTIAGGIVAGGDMECLVATIDEKCQLRIRARRHTD